MRQESVEKAQPVSTFLGRVLWASADPSAYSFFIFGLESEIVRCQRSSSIKELIIQRDSPVGVFALVLTILISTESNIIALPFRKSVVAVKE